jgi:DegV family protein with EDD domain
MKTAIVTDSTAVISTEYINKHANLFVIPLQIVFLDQTFEDGVNINNSTLFEMIEKTNDFPTTSQPSIGKVLELFETLKQDFDEVLYITISSNISGTFSTGLSASKLIEDLEVQVFDSLHTSVIQKYMVETALSLTEKGEHLKTIIPKLEKIRQQSTIYLAVDNLNYLVRTGRVNNIKAFVGSMLKIKPVLKFEDGYINLFSKVRTMKSVFSLLLEFLESQNIDENTQIFLAHAKGDESVLKLKDLVQEKYPNHEISISELSPVISIHTGPNSVGIAWIKL